jgi:hypothetical protein
MEVSRCCFLITTEIQLLAKVLAHSWTPLINASVPPPRVQLEVAAQEQLLAEFIHLTGVAFPTDS